MGSVMYVKAGTLLPATWSVNFCLKQSARDSVLAGNPAGGEESDTVFWLIPSLKMKASLAKHWAGYGVPRSDLANLAFTCAVSSFVRSLSGNRPTPPATASPKLNQLIPWRSSWSKMNPLSGQLTEYTPKSYGRLRAP